MKLTFADQKQKDKLITLATSLRPAWNETSLKGFNNFIKERSQSSIQDLCNKLVKGITKTKLSHSLKLRVFRLCLKLGARKRKDEKNNKARRKLEKKLRRNWRKLVFQIFPSLLLETKQWKEFFLNFLFLSISPEFRTQPSNPTGYG